MVKVFNDNGYIWVVVYAVYVALDKSHHTVSFYDAQYDHCGDYGQFVSSYYVQTILDGTEGLNLQGDVPQWTIAQSTMVRVRTWLASVQDSLKC